MSHTPVAIIGAGPAGLTLAHLLHVRYGIESVIFESRSRADVEETVRAGVLEQGTMNLMRETGVGERMDAEADIDDAIELAIDGQRTRIDLAGLTGHHMAVYPQHEYLKDFIAARLDAGQTIFFETEVTDVTGYDDDQVTVSYTTNDGREHTLTADYVMAGDGSASPRRKLVTELPGAVRAKHEYPYAWFGILVNAPQTQKELIYANSEHGFALISTRTPEIQRYYLQCNPDDTVDMWSDERIWDELHKRVSTDDLRVSEGEIFDKAVLRFRSAVTDPMQRGRLFLAGDAAHTWRAPSRRTTATCSTSTPRSPCRACGRPSTSPTGCPPCCTQCPSRSTSRPSGPAPNSAPSCPPRPAAPTWRSSTSASTSRSSRCR